MNTPTRRQLQRNVPRTLCLSFLQVFMLLMPVIVIFFESRGLALADVLLLQAWFAVLVGVLEVPSGYIADLLGRRGTMIVGGLFLGIGHTWLVFAHGFWPLAAFEASLAVAFSLISGADLALLYDTELALAEGGEHKQKRPDADPAPRVRSVPASPLVQPRPSVQPPPRSHSLPPVGGPPKAVRRLFFARNLSEALAAVLCSVLLLVVSMDGIAVAGAVCGWLPFLLAFGLVEPPRKRLDTQSHGRNAVLILRTLVLDNRILRLTFLALSIWSLTTMYAVWLMQAHWRSEGVELAHFGYIWGALTLLSAVAGRYAASLENRLGTAAMLAFVGIGPVVGYLALGLAGVVAGVGLSSLFFLCRGFGLVILRDALNRRIGSEIRATANSLASFGFRIAFAVTAPVVGGALELWGLDATLLLLAAASAGIFFALILPLILAAGRLGAKPDDAVVASVAAGAEP